MTEADWLACSTTSRMLDYLRDKCTARKLRLFICAALRQDSVWTLLSSKSSRQAVEVGERYSEGIATSKEMTSARNGAHRVFLRMFATGTSAQRVSLGLTVDMTWLDSHLLRHGVTNCIRYICEDGLPIPVALLCDIFGNPFRSPPGLAPSLLNPDVLAHARSAYDDRLLPAGTLNPSHLASLADALAAAGCTDAELLGHLRSPVNHVRGCFAIDLILGRE
jgi:hypothetical protein